MGERQHEEIDPAVFRRFRQGDRDAARLVVERYHRPVLAFLRTHLGDPDLAEDVAQEAFLQLLEHRARLRGPGQLASWLFTVAVRSARRHLHRTRTPSSEAQSTAPTETVPPAQDAGLLEEHRQRIVSTALAALPERDRELVTLRYFAGLQIKELAQTLGMPMGTVGVKIARSLARMRRELETSGHRLEDLL